MREVENYSKRQYRQPYITLSTVRYCFLKPLIREVLLRSQYNACLLRYIEKAFV